MEQDFRIGEWLVCPQLSRIRRGENEVHLELKAMDVLVYLAQRPGEVILKERLMQAIWPDTFVGDAVLTHAVSELRRAFQDDAKNPQVIETLPRRGYRLIASVSEITPEEVASRIEVGQRIGKGAMGEVFLAQDTLLRRPVALKFLVADLEQDDTAKKQLLREARAAAALDHPFICKIYDTGELEGRTFIAMEYVEGETLRQRLARGPIPLDKALQIASEVAEALEAAAERRIVHRDIKPSNIMLAKQGHVKVTDFGVAKRLRTEEGEAEDWTATLTEDVTTRGTLPYMSPEQLKGREVDHRSDIFALGVVLYEMITGVNPFRQPTQLETANAVLSVQPPEMKRYAPETPSAVEETVRKMLAKDPEGRYQSIRELHTDLGALISRQTSGFRMGISRRQRKRIALGALALVAVVAIGALIMLNPWKTPSTLPPTRPVPLTSFPGLELWPALSPDGTFVAYSWNGEDQDNFDIYVQAVGAGESHRLTTDPAEDTFPTWSPDGTRIAFLRKVSETEHTVFVIPVLGGSETRVTGSIFDENERGGGFPAGGLSWSPVEPIIAMADRGPTEKHHSIVLFSLETREKTKLTFPPEGAWDNFPRFSPDGSTVAFHRFGPDQLHLCVQDVHSISARTLMSSDFLFVNGLDWTTDGSAVVVAFKEWLSPNFYLARVPAAGDKPERLSFGEGAHGVSIARSGGRLVYGVLGGNLDIWRVSGPNSPQAASPAKFAASSTRSDWAPAYSPDGSKIAFLSARSGDAEIWRCNAEGREVRQVTNGGKPIMFSWSPTGDRIAFAAAGRSDKQYSIHVVDETGGLSRNLTRDEFGDAAPSWSADGRWIYYNSIRAHDTWQICRVPAEGGASVQLTEGEDPRVTEDGQVLFWREGHIWSLPRNGGVETLVLDEEVLLGGYCTWKENIVYATRKEGGRISIEMFNLTTRKTTELDTGTKAVFPLTISPDGHWILYVDSDPSADLMLVENFR